MGAAERIFELIDKPPDRLDQRGGDGDGEEDLPPCLRSRAEDIWIYEAAAASGRSPDKSGLYAGAPARLQRARPRRMWTAAGAGQAD